MGKISRTISSASIGGRFNGRSEPATRTKGGQPAFKMQVAPFQLDHGPEKLVDLRFLAWSSKRTLSLDGPDRRHILRDASTRRTGIPRSATLLLSAGWCIGRNGRCWRPGPRRPHPSRIASARCSGQPAPPLATTGMETASLTARGDLQVVTVLRAIGVHGGQHDLAGPQLSTSRAQATASRPVPTRPPLINTSQNSSPVAAARVSGSMFTTMHWLPNRRAAWRTKSGFSACRRIDRDLVAAGVQAGPGCRPACGCRPPRSVA